ncbi:MAG: fumarate hydratase C-terminal domain-containing protein [Chloroflexi bacterium]|nr:fumarate hydratase C-terminal domain-containing protein [Chloroflexota bacterium]
MAELTLKAPLSESDTRGLAAGDIVYLDGVIYTGAKLFCEGLVNQGKTPPPDLSRTNVLLHVHPMMKKVRGEYKLLALGPTSSIMYDAYMPPLIRQLKLRAILGKTTLSEATMKVMQELGCVHLTRVGSPENTLVEATKSIIAIHFNDDKNDVEEEATLLLDVAGFGPFIVDIDAHGHNLFRQMEENIDKTMKALYARHGIRENFEYSSAMSSRRS